MFQERESRELHKQLSENDHNSERYHALMGKVHIRLKQATHIQTTPFYETLMSAMPQEARSEAWRDHFDSPDRSYRVGSRYQ